MTDQRSDALAAALPKCPDWCTEDRLNETDRSTRHTRMHGGDRRGRLVLITQTDAPRVAFDDIGDLRREAASITVVCDGPSQFDLRNLTPEQAYALAALVGNAGNERLATLLLDAVGLLKPELVR